ncbi:hypothetical protein ACFE04_003931 [Oxalis oulophora]
MKLISDFTFQEAINLFHIMDIQHPPWFNKLFDHMMVHGFQEDFNLDKRVLLTVLISGSIINARNNFHQMPNTDLLSWITMVCALADLGDELDACRSYQKWGIPDWGPLTFSTMIRVAAAFSLLLAGRQLHSLTMKMGFDKDNSVSAALIHMYTMCGSFQDAQTFFYDMPPQNTAGWNNMIAAYSFHGHDDEALSLFYDMHESGVPTDHLTFSIVIEIYVKLGYLERADANAKLLECCCDWIETRDVGFALSSMYEKKPLESWNALLAGHALHADGYQKTMELFEEMLAQGVGPNHVTFHSLLSACSKGRASYDQAWEYFKSMVKDHRVQPEAMHFACMIELLGRENLLSEAFELLCTAPVEPTVATWAALLTACRPTQHLKLAKLAAEELYALGPEKLKKIYQKLNELMEEVSRVGHADGKVTFLPDVDENEQRIQKYHSERLAIAFGLIHSTDRRIPLRIMQDHRICEDCHNAVRLMAVLTGRKIVVKDVGRFHHFENGKCSCEGYW